MPKLFNFATDVDNSQRAEIRIMQDNVGERKFQRRNNEPSAQCCFLRGGGRHDFIFRCEPTAGTGADAFAHTGACQQPSPSPSAKSLRRGKRNPFAPEPAPALPPGMTGSDVNDPRAKLAPGLYDAGEAAMGIKHLMLVKKPDAFQLGSDDPDDPKVQKTLGQLGMGNICKDSEADAVGASRSLLSRTLILRSRAITCFREIFMA